MKRFLMIALAVLMGVSLVTTVFAQGPTDTAPTSVPEKKVAKKAAPKAKTHEFAGEVTAVDMAAKTLTVKGKKSEKTFDVTDAKMTAEPKTGDKVMVKYTKKDGKMIVKYVGMKHSKKAEAKKEKPAEKPMAPEKSAAPTPATVPAPEPAPAK